MHCELCNLMLRSIILKVVCMCKCLHVHLCTCVDLHVCTPEVDALSSSLTVRCIFGNKVSYWHCVCLSLPPGAESYRDKPQWATFMGFELPSSCLQSKCLFWHISAARSRLLQEALTAYSDTSRRPQQSTAGSINCLFWHISQAAAVYGRKL